MVASYSSLAYEQAAKMSASQSVSFKVIFLALKLIFIAIVLYELYYSLHIH